MTDERLNRIAEYYEHWGEGLPDHVREVLAEVRRLRAENEALRAEVSRARRCTCDTTVQDHCPVHGEAGW